MRTAVRMRVPACRPAGRRGARLLTASVFVVFPEKGKNPSDYGQKAPNSIFYRTRQAFYTVYIGKIPFSTVQSSLFIRYILEKFCFLPYRVAKSYGCTVKNSEESDRGRSGASCSDSSGRITRQASVSRGRLQAALAGLVEGRQTASVPAEGRQYFR